jgi:hypothetical protein
MPRYLSFKSTDSRWLAVIFLREGASCDLCIQSTPKYSRTTRI